MAIFRRKKPVIEAREYDSWEPAAIAAQHAAADGAPQPRRSRNSEGHLKAAVDAIEAAKVARGEQPPTG